MLPASKSVDTAAGHVGVLQVQACRVMLPASGSEVGTAAGHVDVKKQQHAWRC